MRSILPSLQRCPGSRFLEWFTLEFSFTSVLQRKRKLFPSCTQNVPIYPSEDVCVNCGDGGGALLVLCIRSHALVWVLIPFGLASRETLAQYSWESALSIYTQSAAFHCHTLHPPHFHGLAGGGHLAGACGAQPLPWLTVSNQEATLSQTSHLSLWSLGRSRGCAHRYRKLSPCFLPGPPTCTPAFWSACGGAWSTPEMGHWGWGAVFLVPLQATPWPPFH